MAALPPLALAYHGVQDLPPAADPQRLFVAPRDLRRHISALRRWGYTFVTFGELMERHAAGGSAGHVALTFDDGLEDNLRELVPVLGAERVPATVFVVSRWLGRPHPDAPAERLLTADELRELHRAGVEIGGHTATHADVSTLSYQDALRELRDGRTELEAVIGAPVTVAAYPYGRASDDARRACRDAGFTSACRAGTGEGDANDPFDFPRQDMGNRSTITGLRLKRNDRYEPLMAFKPARAARKLAYRLPR